MNISPQLKLQATLKGVLHNDLLGLDVLNVPDTAGQLYGSNLGRARQPGDTGQGGYSGDSGDCVSTLKVDNIGHGLLPDQGDGSETRGAEGHPHHLSGEQSGPVRDEEPPNTLPTKSADGKRFGMICRVVEGILTVHLLRLGLDIDSLHDLDLPHHPSRGHAQRAHAV